MILFQIHIITKSMTKWEVWFILAKVEVKNLLLFLFVYLSVFDLLLYDTVRYMFI